MNQHANIVCIGGANIDRKAQAREKLQLGASNPVTIRETLGGVARNVAENLARLGQHVRLLALLGDDAEGGRLLESCRAQGIGADWIERVAGARTGSYLAALDPDGELQIGLSDMEVCDRLDWRRIERHWTRIAAADFIFADCNLPAETLARLFAACREIPGKLIVDAVSNIKVGRLPGDLRGIGLLLANCAEASALCGFRIKNKADCKLTAERLRKHGAGAVVITLGSAGVYLGAQDFERWFDVAPCSVVDVTGAGDAFTAGMIFGLARGGDWNFCASCGLAAAAITIGSPESVAPQMSVEELLSRVSAS